MGSDNAHDGGISCRDLGICRSGPARGLRRSNEQGRLILNDRGSSVVAAVVATALSTGIALSVLALGLSAYNTFLLRDATIEAASRAARFGAPSQLPYLMRRIESELPMLSFVQVDETAADGSIGYQVSGTSLGLGFLPGGEVHVRAMVASEILG